MCGSYLLRKKGDDQWGQIQGQTILKISPQEQTDKHTSD